MAKVYRLSDRIRLKVDDIEVVIGPLSIHQKSEVEAVSSASGLLKATLVAMKYAIKDVKGLVDMNNQPYELKRNEDGSLSDESLDDLFNLEMSFKLSSIALQLINTIPSEFVDINTGKKLEGVEFILDKGQDEKKSKVVPGF